MRRTSDIDGRTLRGLRKKIGLSQEKMALLLGYHCTETISRFETGKCHLTDELKVEIGLLQMLSREQLRAFVERRLGKTRREASQLSLPFFQLLSSYPERGERHIL